jgi:glucose-6-phosphate 1-epimerase
VLEPTEAISKVWPYDFKLAYVVTLAAHQLSTNLHVFNESGQAFNFQALLHTYYAVNAATAKVAPLTGLTYLNKVKGGIEETEQRQEVDVTSFTDSVYKDAVSKSAGKYQITDGSVSFELHTRGFKDLVVWNPSQEAGSKIGDMESGGW